MEYGKPFNISVTKINAHLIYKFIEHFLFMTQQIPSLFSQMEEEWNQSNSHPNYRASPDQICRPAALQRKKLEKLLKSVQVLRQDLVCAFDNNDDEPQPCPDALLILLGETIVNPKVSCVLSFTYNDSAPTQITTAVQNAQVRHVLRQILPTIWPQLLTPTKLHLLLHTGRNHRLQNGWFPRQTYSCKPLQLWMKKQTRTTTPRLFLLHLSENSSSGIDSPSIELLFEHLCEHTQSTLQTHQHHQDTIWFQRAAVIQGLKL